MRRFLIAFVTVAMSILGALPVAAQQLPDEIADPPGDTVDFGGNPAAGPDLLGVTGVEVSGFLGDAAWDLFERLFGSVPGPGVTEIIPDQPGPLLRGGGPLILVHARLSAPLPDAPYCQVVMVFRTEGHDAYSGSPGDPNNGNDTSLDLFRADGEWEAGRTEYRDGQFSFSADYAEIAARITDTAIDVVFPVEAIPDGVTWQIWVICGDDAIAAGRDFTDLGSFAPGFIPTLTLAAPTTTTTPTTTQPPARSTTTELIPPTTTLPPSSERSGGSPIVLVALAALAIGAVSGLFIYRKKKGPCDCDEERAVYDAALEDWKQAQYGSQAAREDADESVGRHNRAVNELFALDALRPRRGEHPDQAAFEAADAAYQARRAELEGNIVVLAEDIEASAARAADAEAYTERMYRQAEAMHRIYSACVQKCFGSTTTREGAATTTGTAPSEPPGGVAPPPAESTPSECTEPATQEIEGPVQRFQSPVSGNVRVSLATDRGPIDDLEDIVSGNPIADQIAEFLGADASLEIPGDGLGGAGSRAWEKAVTQLGAMAFNVLKREVHVVVAYDLEEIALACVTLQECRAGKWVTVGKRLDEKRRSQRTVTTTWSTVNSARPLGATFTSVKNGLAAAEESASQMRAFSAGCR